MPAMQCNVSFKMRDREGMLPHVWRILGPLCIIIILLYDTESLIIWMVFSLQLLVLRSGVNGRNERKKRINQIKVLEGRCKHSCH